MKLLLIVMVGVFTTTLYTQKFGFVTGFNFANIYDTMDAETDVGKSLKP